MRLAEFLEKAIKISGTNRSPRKTTFVQTHGDHHGGITTSRCEWHFDLFDGVGFGTPDVQRQHSTVEGNGLKPIGLNCGRAGEGLLRHGAFPSVDVRLNELDSMRGGEVHRYFKRQIRYRQVGPASSREPCWMCHCLAALRQAMLLVAGGWSANRRSKARLARTHQGHMRTLESL